MTDRERMMRGLEQLLFDHDWIDTDVVALLDEDDLRPTNSKKENTLCRLMEQKIETWMYARSNNIEFDNGEWWYVAPICRRYRQRLDRSRLRRTRHACS